MATRTMNGGNLLGLATLNFEEEKAPGQTDENKNTHDDRRVIQHTFRGHSDRSLALKREFNDYRYFILSRSSGDGRQEAGRGFGL